ncbi:restriction endonuclease subunit S [Lacticaseibacillus paracasei]|uniref:restriction endonuclease subunit S n=1 Tax=Lacticaseibacillus paracasei TaxID=1597 RepID=UPI000343A79D|nr:restriction endonuclease subunit S [Lacticaseibacillus paracasei]EPD04382.1 type I restriction enzyme, S subunit [Lacticaseibacillus paracasei subsp. paracasei CNCM I-2877]MDM7549311.1 restriction endonuclease subunit S [Lacticaseibacillus paracasei]
MSKDVKNVPALRFKGYSDAWEKRKLSEVTNLITKGTTPREKGGRGEVNFIKVENLSKNGNIFTTSKVSVSEHQGYLARSILQENDILFSIAGSLGRTAIVPKLVLPANTNQALAIIRLSTGCVEFVATYLSGEAIDRYIRRNPTVGAQPNISLTQVASLQIDWPSLHEQEVISKLFARVKDLIAATQDKIDALEQAKRALLQRLFDQSWRFKGYSDPWEKRKLREVSDVRDGTHASPKYYSQGYPLVTSKNLTSAGLDFSNISLISELDYKNINKRSRVDKGDILFGMIGTIGTPVMVHESNFAIKNVALIKEREAVLNSFLVQLLKSPAFINYIRNENVGGTQKFLSLNTIRNFRFSFPTSKEQAMVSRFLEKIDSLIAATQSRLSSLELLKKALLQDLFI